MKNKKNRNKRSHSNVLFVVSCLSLFSPLLGSAAPATSPAVARRARISRRPKTLVIPRETRQLTYNIMPDSPNSPSSSLVFSFAKDSIARVRTAHPLLGFGVSRLEALTSLVPVQVKDRVNSYGKPLIDGVDAALFAGRRVLSVRRPLELLAQFYLSAASIFLEGMKEKAAGKEKFVAALRTRLASVSAWSEALVAPAEFFFDRARALENAQKTPMKIIQTLRSSLPEDFEAKILAIYQSGMNQMETFTQSAPVQSVLLASQSTIDRVLPPIDQPQAEEGQEAEEESALTVLGVSSHILTRVHSHVSTRLSAPLVAQVHSYQQDLNQSVDALKANVFALHASVRSLLGSQLQSAQQAVISRIPVSLQVHLTDLQARLKALVDQASSIKDETQRRAILLSHQIYENSLASLQSKSIQVLGSEREALLEHQILQAKQAVNTLLSKITQQQQDNQEKERLLSEEQQKLQAAMEEESKQKAAADN